MPCIFNSRTIAHAGAFPFVVAGARLTRPFLKARFRFTIRRTDAAGGRFGISRTTGGLQQL
jgi:hypothetical protein